MVIFNIKYLIQLVIFGDLIILNKKSFHLRKHPFYLPNKKSILENDESKREPLIKGRIFLDKCLNLKNKEIYKYVNQPKVTVIIPLYNCESTIESSIHSIQYQNMSDIEIILINDYSIDNTSKIINNILKNDHRITIINNHKNMGSLYSRSIGALKAKGEYIFSLDNDDLSFDYDLIDNIYKRGKKDNLDIIHFLTVNINNYTEEIMKMKHIYTYQYPDELYLEQPELGLWMIRFNEKFLVHNIIINSLLSINPKNWE